MGRARSRVVAHQFSTTMGTWSRRPSRRGCRRPAAAASASSASSCSSWAAGENGPVGQQDQQGEEHSVSSTTYCSITQGWVMSLTSGSEAEEKPQRQEETAAPGAADQRGEGLALSHRVGVERRGVRPLRPVDIIQVPEGGHIGPARLLIGGVALPVDVATPVISSPKRTPETGSPWRNRAVSWFSFTRWRP